MVFFRLLQLLKQTKKCNRKIITIFEAQESLSKEFYHLFIYFSECVSKIKSGCSLYSNVVSFKLNMYKASDKINQV